MNLFNAEVRLYENTPITVKRNIRYNIIAVIFLICPAQELMAEEKILIIDDPASSGSKTENADQWRVLTDKVSGISKGPPYH